MQAWADLLNSLETELGPQAVAEWLRPLRITHFDAGNLYLDATPFQQDWFEEHVRPHIEDHFQNNNQRPIRIHWETPQPPKKTSATAPRFSSDPLEPTLRLENYLPTNPIAHQMALELASGSTPFNPVYFSGPTGSGKTHLLTGIAHALAPHKRVFFVHAETFTHHVVQAIRLGHMQEFRKTYREIDVLILEDVHLLARRNSTQEEFFHTFNTLHTLNRPILLSSPLPPSELQDIEPRLISRFEWGITLPLNPPPDLLPILQQKAALLNYTTTPELLTFLLTRFISHPKAPIEALHALALRAPRPLPLSHIERTLSDLLAVEQAAILTPEKIIKTIAAHFGIRPEDLTGKSQQREYVQPRQLAMYYCRHTLKLPYQAIGRLFSRDHSTVLTSIRLVDAALSAKAPPFSEAAPLITRKLHRI